MENVKEGCGGAKSNNEENPNNNNNNDSITNSSIEDDSLPPISRTPFTNLSQVDADLALARTLQEQERAYMMLRMNGGEGSSDLGSSEAGSFLHEEDEDGYDDDDSNEDDVIGTDADEDAFDAHRSLEEEDEDEVDSTISEEFQIDPSAFDNDEAFARALQDAEERELAARLMALTGGNDWTADNTENDNNSQDTWEDVDPDELSYEELLALGEVVGTESRGLSADTIASLPSVNYKAQSNQDGSAEQCVICRLEYEDEDSLTVLSCKHSYHSECINNWLQINKVCPVCSAEVSNSTNL